MQSTPEVISSLSLTLIRLEGPAPSRCVAGGGGIFFCVVSFFLFLLGVGEWLDHIRLQNSPRIHSFQRSIFRLSTQFYFLVGDWRARRGCQTIFKIVFENGTSTNVFVFGWGWGRGIGHLDPQRGFAPAPHRGQGGPWTLSWFPSWAGLHDNVPDRPSAKVAPVGWVSTGDHGT